LVRNHMFGIPLAYRETGPKTYENQKQVYERFATEDAWVPRWTVERLAVLNMNLNARITDCKGIFDLHVTSSNITASAKREWLGRILAEYYDAIDAIRVPKSSGNHIYRALPFIARLFHKLAILHPFCNGNSRTRTMVLQTELVRQGGHPTVLWDNYHGIYQIGCYNGTPLSMLENYAPMCMEAAQQFVLDGWCSWELAYNKGASPFSPFVCDTGTSYVPPFKSLCMCTSTPHSGYNSQTGACGQGPPRTKWVPPFSKHRKNQCKRPESDSYPSNV